MAVADQSSGLPPSALYVEDKLEEHGPMTHTEIVEATRMAPSTVSDATSELEAQGIVEKQYDPGAGTDVYSLR